MARSGKKRWNDREKKIMKHLGARRQPLSGAGAIFKEDGSTLHLLLQQKSTDGQSISMTRDDLNILFLHALTEGKLPVFVADFVDGPLMICVPFENLLDVATAFVNEGTLALLNQDAQAHPDDAQENPTYEL
jgi:hypothetical protein